MTSNLDDLFRVKKKDLPKAIETLSQSFSNDPLSVYMFPDEKERMEFLPNYFLSRITYGIIFGEVYATSENFEGVAVWIKPKNTDMTMWKMFRAGGMKLFRAVGKEAREKMFGILRYTSKLHHETTTEPHWHLTPLGVDPKYQGKGYASKLLKAMMKKFDNEKASCFLETQSKTNVEIYKRYGFKVAGEGKIPKAELEHWTMIREPVE